MLLAAFGTPVAVRTSFTSKGWMPLRTGEVSKVSRYCLILIRGPGQSSQGRGLMSACFVRRNPVVGGEG